MSALAHRAGMVPIVILPSGRGSVPYEYYSRLLRERLSPVGPVTTGLANWSSRRFSSWERNPDKDIPSTSTRPAVR